MSDTPRTDAARSEHYFQVWRGVTITNEKVIQEIVPADFARQLERELAECEKELIIWFSYVDPCDMYPEHDALWRERNKKVHPQNYKEWK